MENLKIVFWVVAIGIYIYTQIKDSIKKGGSTDPIPNGSPIPTINTKRKEQPKPVIVQQNTYSESTYHKPEKVKTKRFQTAYNKAEEVRRRVEGEESNPKEKYAQGAFYKETPAQPVVVNYEDTLAPTEERKSVFGVDQHLKPYELHNKQKHPLITFLSNKSNLKNAFITGEILKRPE
jgi:hypothetical protein